MRHSQTFLRAVMLIGIVCCTSVAQAGVFDDDEARRQIVDVRTRTEQRIDGLARGQLDQASQLQALREENATLRGQIEALLYRLDTAERRQQSYYVDLDSRLRAVEGALNAAREGQGQTVGGVVGNGGAAIVAPVQAKPDPAREAQEYENALNLFKANKYKEAAAAFAGFVKNYPESTVAPSAQLWEGHSWFALQDCRRSADAMNQVVVRWPNSPKAPDALLGIADCQPAKVANKTLENLIAKYPDSAAAKKARQRLNQK